MTHAQNRPDPVLPSDAPSEWLSLAAQIVGLHPRGAETVRHAFAARVEPETFCNLQLAHWTGQEGLPLPIMSFGEHFNGPCRRFGCDGEIEPLPGKDAPAPTDAEALDWINRFREAGGRFQWMDRDLESVWLGVPVDSLADVSALSREITPEMRRRVAAAVTPLLRTNGGFY